MATINSVQKSIHLPLSGLSSPRVLMCSASVGTEGSVTLQLRDANSSDSNQSTTDASNSDNALTIGYPDPDMLADVLGSLQTASIKSNQNNSSAVQVTTTSSAGQTPINGDTNANQITISRNPPNSHTNNNINHQHTNPITANKITISRRQTSASSCSSASSSSTTSSRKDSSCSSRITVHTVSTSTNTTTKTNSYIKNCLIRSSSVSNSNTVTSLAQIMTNGSATSSSSASSSSSLSLISNAPNHSSGASSAGQICSSSTNSNCLFSSTSSNDSSASTSSTSCSSSSQKSTNTSSSAAAARNVPNSANPPNSVAKKNRQKILSPTRHGPQQCQICNKIFGNASALAKHKLTHSDERKYVCAMCSKAFKRQDHLNGHMMTHRNKKPYECKVESCGKSYCDARSLRRHTENHHAGAVSPPNQNEQTSSATSATTTKTNSSLSPATASGDANSPDGATCIRTYISTGDTVVDAATGVALTDEQIKAFNLPIKTGVTLLSPTSSSSSSSTSNSSSSGTTTIITSKSPTITLTDNSRSMEGGEGLTREQLDLIGRIMQQTKQTSAQVTVSSPHSVNSYKVDASVVTAQTLAQRSRSWNMQLLNNGQNVAIAVDDLASETGTTSKEPLSRQLVAAINPHLLNIVKIEQKQVECNLCHRKFKNIPALNGHMRLHGGYFKKDTETKKNDKKESSGPPLQTASIGVRALIEEKIISKRSKDLNKAMGAFVIPAPPNGGNGTSSATSTLRRSLSDLEGGLSHKLQLSTSCTGTNSTASSSPSNASTSGGLSIQQIGLPHNIEIFSTKQQQKNSTGLASLSIGKTNATLTLNSSSAIKAASSSMASASSTSSKSTSTTTDPKDSTLIELLKRGTRIAVTSAKKPPTPLSTNLQIQNNSVSTATLLASGTAVSTNTSRQIVTNNNRTVIIPSDVQVISTKSKTTSSISSRASTPSSISLSEASPLSLTLSQSANDSTSDVYTLTYSNEAAVSLFGNAEVFNVSDTDMLLQTVDAAQLLTDDIKTEHSEDFTLSDTNIEQMDNIEHMDTGTTIESLQRDLIKIEENSVPNAALSELNTNAGSSAGQLSELPTSLPPFQQFHSKEIIMQTSAQVQAVSNLRAMNSLSLPDELKQQLNSMSSPMNSPLAYPTPPSSHENMAQSSPYVDESHGYGDSNNCFFEEKCGTSFLSGHASENAFFKNDANEFSDSDKILQLKSELEDTTFDSPIKVEDLLSDSANNADCDLRDFTESNLSFLDEDQEFLGSSRNTTSPLPESFFTSGIGSAEDVKEVLREVLPEENMDINMDTNADCDGSDENIIDLYYLSGMGLQSQMMSNSDDPFLSSSSARMFNQQTQQQQRSSILQQQNENQVDQERQQQDTYQQNQQQIHNQQPQQQLQQDQSLNLPQYNAVNVIQDSNHYMNSQMMIASGNQTHSQLQYNLENGCQQEQQQHQQQQQQQHQQLQEHPVDYVDNATLQSAMDTFDEQLIQPVIYTGSTDKQEIHLTEDLQQSQQQHQQQQNTMGLMSPDSGDDASSIYLANSAEPAMAQVSAAMPDLMPAPPPPPPPRPPPRLQKITHPYPMTVVTTSLQPLSNQTNSILKRRLRGIGGPPILAQTYSKYHTIAPYSSKLKKATRTHYTPPPMLNPDRKGLGLYCNVRKELNGGLLSFDTFSDYEDRTGSVDFSDESKVNLGSAYQAQIPAYKDPRSDSIVEETVGAVQMWDPNVLDDESKLRRYIELSKSSAVPMGCHTEEVALTTLLNSEGNTSSAVLAMMQTKSCSVQMQWSATELENFLRSLEKYGKDFKRISKKVTTRTMGECVQMYYFWKKFCVDCKVTHKKPETNANSNNNNTVSVIQHNQPNNQPASSQQTNQAQPSKDHPTQTHHQNQHHQTQQQQQQQQQQQRKTITPMPPLTQSHKPPTCHPPLKSTTKFQYKILQSQLQSQQHPHLKSLLQSQLQSQPRQAMLVMRSTTQPTTRSRMEQTLETARAKSEDVTQKASEQEQKNVEANKPSNETTAETTSETHQLNTPNKQTQMQARNLSSTATTATATTQPPTSTPSSNTSTTSIESSTTTTPTKSHTPTQPNAPSQTPSSDPKPYMCEIRECSASFSSKAALHGHIRIHTIGKSASAIASALASNNSNTATTNTPNNNNATNNHNQSNIGNSNNNNTTSPTNASTASSNGSSSTNNSKRSIGLANTTPTEANQRKDIVDFPCKVCGKVFSKVKSRSAHMKTHRTQDNSATENATNGAPNGQHTQHKTQLSTQIKQLIKTQS